MADLAVTASSVVAGVDATTEFGMAGETIAAGKAIYRSSTTKKWMLADNNSAIAEARKATAFALNSASASQPLAVHKSGDLVLGGGLTPGAAYYLSDTPGGICPLADVGGGEFVCLVGLAKSATVLSIDFQYPGVSL